MYLHFVYLSVPSHVLFTLPQQLFYCHAQQQQEQQQQKQ